jgi:hypothetical protein
MGEEPAGGREIPFLCDEDVNDLAKLVDRPVQIDPPAADFDVDTPRESVVKRRQFRVSAKRLFRGRACWFGGSARVWTAACSRGCGARRCGCHRRLCGGRSGLGRRVIWSAWRRPTSGRRRLQIRRAETTRLRPDARVMGAVPAKLRSPRASVNRCGSSPSSPSRRAPTTGPSPGKLVMIEAWACWSNRVASSALSAAMASLIAVIVSISPIAATPRACSTGAGWWLVRSW